MRLDKSPNRLPDNPHVSRGEMRRLVAMGIVAAIVIFFIVQWVLSFNASVPDPVEGIEVGTVAQGGDSRPASDGFPPGAGIVIPSDGDPQALAGVRDETDLEVTDPALLYLIKTLMSLSPEEIRSRVDPEVKIEDYFYHPAEHRGRFVRFAGRLEKVERMWLPIGNPSGVEKAFWGIVTDRNMNPVQFIAVEQERPFREGQETILLEGRFYKIRSFINKEGNRVKFPLLVARQMQSVRDVTFEEAFPAGLGYLVAGMASIALLALLIASWRSARRDRHIDELRRSRRRSPVKVTSPPRVVPPADANGGP
ncbi:MAG: hypothetical protein O7H41_00235 [Planctomycetota bacterium]|nr:hypothetical protein [Planctomycetota bacterium]